MTTKALVLHSGGLDSTTCLYMALRAHGSDDHTAIETVSIDYGQRHIKETEYAAKVAAMLELKHHIVKLPSMPNSMLTDKSIEVPNMSYADVKGVSPTYVPFRNGQLLSIVTGLAQSIVTQQDTDYDDRDLDDWNPTKSEFYVYFGAHSEDALNWAYPDCTPEFIGAMANAIYVGTYHRVRLITPLQWMMKDQIVQAGQQLGVPFHMTWSCYKGEEKQCGTCMTCRARREGFKNAGVLDPTEYAA